MAVRSEMLGLEELARNVGNIRAELTGDRLARAGEASMNIMANAARQKAPYRTGTLRRSIHVEVTEVGAHSAMVEVGTGEDVPYAAIQEFGGVIVPKIAKMLAWRDRGTGEMIFAKSVTIPARPYMRPAWDETIDKVKDSIIKILKNLIEKGR